MNLPAASIPLGRLGSIVGPWRGVLGYAAFTLIVFFVALTYGLPHDLIVKRVLDEATRDAPVRIVPGAVSFSFPNGYRLEDVRVSHRDDPSLGAELAEITVSTPLLGILVGSIDAADFSGRLYDGTFDGSVDTGDGAVATSFTAQGVSLAQLSRRFLAPPGAVDGTISLNVDITGDGRSAKTNKGTVEVRARGVSLDGIVAQGFTVPDLTFQTIDLDAALQGSRLQVEDLKARGDEVSLRAKGDVLIRDPAPRSVLNLELEIDVASDARPGLRVATSLLPPKKTGKKGWALRGSLAAPSLR